jgi:hypothetical protein
MFVTSGIHAGAYGWRRAPDFGALNAMFAEAGVTPKAMMRRWCGEAATSLTSGR